MGSPTREELEKQPTWVGTFEFVSNPGAYRVLMQAPVGESLYWSDVHRTSMPWQWGITSVYEGDAELKRMISEKVFKLVNGELPWERKKPERQTEINHAKVLEVAKKMLGLSNDLH